MQGRPKFSELHTIRIRNFSDLYSPAFGPNMKRYKVFLRIQSECRKMRTRKTPNMDTFHAVLVY